MAKRISISSDGITFFLLPGGTGEFSREGEVVTDTIFGQTYNSGLAGAITWSINANAIFKGFVGFVSKLLKQGTPTSVAGEPMSLVSGKTYQVTAASRRIWDRSAPLTIFDDATDVTAQIKEIDYLFGKVTFVDSYTVSGSVTADITYFPQTTLARFTSYTLNQTADAIRDSDIPTLSTNGGFHTFLPGLKSVSIELPTVFSETDNWHQELIDRNEFIIEINPDGLGDAGSVARGFFRLMTDRQSGDVGALEEETLSFELNVPFNATGPEVALPFGWSHGVNSTMPEAIRRALSAWENDEFVFGEYLHDGVSGWRGEAVVTDMTLNGGMDTPNVFTVALNGNGSPTPV